MKKIGHDIQKVCSPEERNCRDGGSFPLVHLSGESRGRCYAGFTLRTYTHTSNPMQVKAAEPIGSVMGKNL